MFEKCLTALLQTAKELYIHKKVILSHCIYVQQVSGTQTMGHGPVPGRGGLRTGWQFDT